MVAVDGFTSWKGSVSGMTRLYVTCPKCSHRNERAGNRRKCAECRETLPKRRIPEHKKQLRDVLYQEWEQRSWDIHGTVWEFGACGVCGRMPIGNRHDRDHDHDTGVIRGLACTGTFGCNRMMPRKLTLERARELSYFLNEGMGFALLYDALTPYLPRDLTPERAEQIAAYLERVENFYGSSDG
jgi:hypothetical protein